MPLYEYHCSKCDKTIEVMRKFSDPPLTEHEGCGGALERLLSAPAFQLKGTGWYLTDYGKGGTKPAPRRGQVGGFEGFGSEVVGGERRRKKPTRTIPAKARAIRRQNRSPPPPPPRPTKRRPSGCRFFADHFDGAGGVGRHGFRSAADQEAAEAAAAVGAEHDPIGGPGGGFLEDDFFGGWARTEIDSEVVRPAASRIFRAESMASSVRFMAAARCDSRCLASRAGISNAPCRADMPSSTALNTRISVPAGQGRAASDSAAYCEPSDPSTASSTFRPALAGGVAHDRHRARGEAQNGFRYAAQEESFDGAHAVRSDYDQIRAHGRGMIEDDVLGIALRLPRPLPSDLCKRRCVGGAVHQLLRVGFHFLDDDRRAPRVRGC